MLVALTFVVLATSLAAAERGANICAEYDLVNPFIGTGGFAYGYGGINPGAQLPFSPMRLGPDTTDTVIDMSYRHFSGYNANDKIIRGFSHTHLVGGGVNDLGNFGIMPTVTDDGMQQLKALPIQSRPFWWSTFDKESESASPGFYNVELTRPSISVGLTAASSFAGIHEYRWDRSLNASKIPSVVIDMCHAAKYEVGDDNICLEASVSIDPATNSFTGKIHKQKGLSGDIWIYISGEIEIKTPSGAAVKDWTTCTSANPQTGEHTCSADTSGTSTSGALFTVVRFGVPDSIEARRPQEDLKVEIRTAISFISEDMATQNLRAAFVDTTDAKKIGARTKQTWCELLHEVQVTALPDMYANSNDLNVLLNSAHYRSMMSPTTYTETGGLYVGMDKVVHNVTAERLAKYGEAGLSYSDFSLWDTVRTQHPWQLLRNERYALDFARSMIEMTAQQNAFPRWPLASHESGCMIGESGMAVIVEAILAGLGDKMDVASIQPTLVAQATQNVPLNGRSDVDNYMTLGYVTQEADGSATSSTLSYAFDDYLLAKISEYTGDAANAQAALARSKNYANVWSPESLLFCPKYANGTISCPRAGDSATSWGLYKEGDAFHWSWFVPHDPAGLMALYPSRDAYLNALETFFTKHLEDNDKFGQAKPNRYYWAGNEHDFLAPWMFNFAGAGACTRSQYWGRQLIPLHFKNAPNGIPGNEDYGSMATWVMFASFGLYPQAGTSKFLLSAPSVVSASIKLHSLQKVPISTLEIVTYNNTAANTFVQKLLVNGREHSEPWIDRTVLAAPGGCKLEFFMSDVEVSGLCM
jgi:predicted alpha-1,2-mannosidase